MSVDASVELPFGNDRHRFRLGAKQWRELQQLRKLGPRRLFERVRNGDWFEEDLHEVIRVGLIGGGMAPADALRLHDAYAEAWPLAERENIAILVMAAALFGVEDDPVGKAVAGAATSATTSASPASTATPRRPAGSRRKKSTA